MNHLTVESKLPNVGTSIFSVMSALANQHGAINLSQGFPDFPVDPEMINLVQKAMKDGFNQYPPSPGYMPLREQIAALTEEVYTGVYDPETEITVTSGATEALFCAISAMIGEGDEVIVFEPAYDSYVPVIELNNGIPVFIPLEFPDYKINWENVKKRISSRTKMIILNSPHNPSGSALTAQDMKELSNILKNKQIYVLSDEVYEHIIFDGLEHQSVARFPELAKRSMIVSSFGKTFHATGWKVGYCLAPKPLMAEFRKVHQFVTFTTSTPFQVAISEYMKNRSRILDLKNEYQEKRDYFLKAVSGSRFKPLNCQGSYFQLMSYADISMEKDVDFAKRMTIENKLAAIPVSVFYHTGEDNKVLRFCFAKQKETIDKAVEIIQKI